MRVVSFLASLLLAAGPPLAQAAAIPILEFKRQLGIYVGTPLPASTPLVLTGNVAVNGVDKFNWTTHHTPSDVGESFYAPADIINGAQNVLNVTTGYYQLRNAPNDQGSFTLNNTPPYANDPCHTADANYSCQLALVTDLRDYYVTAIERIVNHLELFANGDGHSVIANQTIRYWGEVRPPLPGDFNRNGTVDAADYVLWRKQVPDYGPLHNGSGQGIFAGLAIPDDYAYWRARFGGMYPTTLSANVIPEPSGLMQFVLASLLVHVSRWFHGG